MVITKYPYTEDNPNDCFRKKIQLIFGFITIRAPNSYKQRPKRASFTSQKGIFYNPICKPLDNKWLQRRK